MKCQDRDCKREAEGPPVLVAWPRVEFEVNLCPIHTAGLADELAAIERVHDDNSSLRGRLALVDWS